MREISYKNLFLVGFVGIFIGMFMGLGAIIFICLVFIAILILKFGIDLSDSLRQKFAFDQNWARLMERIKNVSNEEILKDIIELTSNVGATGSTTFIPNERWGVINQKPDVAFQIYAIIAALNEKELSPKKRGIKEIAILGLAQIKDGFGKVLSIYQQTTDNNAKSNLGKTLTKLADVAPIPLLLLFIQNVVDNPYQVFLDGQYYTLHHASILDLINVIINRAHELSKEEGDFVFDYLARNEASVGVFGIDRIYRKRFLQKRSDDLLARN